MRVKFLFLGVISTCLILASIYWLPFLFPEDTPLKEINREVQVGGGDVEEKFKKFSLGYIGGEGRVLKHSVKKDGEKWIVVLRRNPMGDSIYETRHKLTFEMDNGRAILKRHQYVHRGRGRFGWTTRPTS